ncbi:BLUF domain-containing protein [Roseicella aerolata]|uniref:BLUF domain-containing protein n=1 Tax=Roseicella aerolata TaxID=2883479 RepID=A0A9X1IBP7_9PROT|nr:BLUF domain-containing protein [Roseicella aerolata]MCB4821871.1 BLUF domain-containing protein [Roseicella aerolata]
MSGRGLFRLVYASRCLLEEAALAGEIPRILEVSRRNNAARGVTGALLFSADAFVQALEGPQEGVEQIFERIQCDPRHAEAVVLEAGPVPARDFAGWSMAYAGRRTDIRFAALQAAPRTASPAMLDLLHGALGRVTAAAVPAC